MGITWTMVSKQYLASVTRWYGCCPWNRNRMSFQVHFKAFSRIPYAVISERSQNNKCGRTTPYFQQQGWTLLFSGFNRSGSAYTKPLGPTTEQYRDRGRGYLRGRKDRGDGTAVPTCLVSWILNLCSSKQRLRWESGPDVSSVLALRPQLIQATDRRFHDVVQLDLDVVDIRIS